MNYLPVHAFVSAFFSVIFYLSVLCFASFQPQGRILTYTNCNMTLQSITLPHGGQVLEVGESSTSPQFCIRELGGRTIVIAAHAVENFAEVCQLIDS